MEGIILEKEIITGRGDIIYIYRKLVAGLTQIESLDGWMIVRMEFKTGEKGFSILKDTGNNIKFIKMRKAYSVISANIIYNNIEYALIMDIVKPGSISGINSSKAVMPAAGGADYVYLFTLKYTKDDIRGFIEAAGDSNPIHKADKPVVPGFLLFEDIILKECGYKGTMDNMAAGYAVYFRNPVFAGDEVEVYRVNNGTGEIIALRDGILAMQAEIYGGSYGESIYSRRGKKLYRYREQHVP